MEESVFESEKIAKSYFSLAVPVVLSMVISIVYNITDTYFIALTGNTDLVAGISLCAPVFTLLMGFGNIFGQGGSSVLSRLMGKNDCENQHRVSSFCFYIAIAFGIAAAVVMILLRRPILGLLGADEQTADYALPYFTCFCLGAPAVMLTFIHPNLLRAEGMSRESMFATVSGSLVNIILDPILIFGLGLGAAGAAIATVIGYLFTDIYALRIVTRKSKALSIAWSDRRAEREDVGQIMTIGLSAAISNITQSVCLILTNQCLLPYGNDKIAAMGIVQKISMIVMLIIVGFAFGGAPMIGYTYGAGKRDKLRRQISFILKFLCGTAFAMSAVMILLAPAVVRAFFRETEMAQIGSYMLRTQLIGMTFMAAVLFATVYFQATGQAVPALVMALSRQGLVFALVLYAAVRIAGYQGILLTQFLSDLLSAGLAALLFLRQGKRLRS